jgi:hypothetical protein
MSSKRITDFFNLPGAKSRRLDGDALSQSPQPAVESPTQGKKLVKVKR